MRNLAALDLNLLVAFDALLIEQSVTRAGHRIGLSQPALSKALQPMHKWVRRLLRDVAATI